MPLFSTVLGSRPPRIHDVSAPTERLLSASHVGGRCLVGSVDTPMRHDSDVHVAGLGSLRIAARRAPWRSPAPSSAGHCMSPRHPRSRTCASWGFAGLALTRVRAAFAARRAGRQSGRRAQEELPRERAASARTRALKRVLGQVQARRKCGTTIRPRGEHCGRDDQRGRHWRASG
jgi:hypothetical protein